MKKQLTIVSLVTVLFTLIFAIPLFNQYSISLVNNYYGASKDNTQWGHVTVERDYAALDPLLVHTVMEEEAIKNNLVIYQLVQNYNDSGTAELGLYVTKNETVLSEYILLAKGKLDNLNEVYSTLSKDKAYQIANIGYSEQVVSINPFVNQQDNGGYLYFKNLQGTLDENVAAWIEGITNRLGAVVCHVQHEMANFDSNEAIAIDLFANKLIKLSLALILVVYVCLTVFQLYKKVAYYKLEGHSNGKIYWLIFEKDYLVISLISLGILILYAWIQFGGALPTLKVFIKLLISQWIQIIVLVQGLSLGLLVIIASIPLVTSSKGKNYLDEILFLGYIGKFIVTLIMVPLILPNINHGKDLMTMLNRHDQIYEQYDHTYRFGTQVASAWVTDMGSENVINLYNDLVKETNLFRFGMGMMNFSIDNISDLELVYMGNWEYLINNQLVKEGDDPGIYRIFLTDNIKDKGDYYLDYFVNKYATYGVTKEVFELIIIKPDYKIFDFEQLLFAKQLYNLPIVYIPIEEEFAGQVYHHMFTYDGTLSQAQTYINQKFMDYGYAPMFRIVNEQSSFQSYYLTMFNNRLIQLIKFMFIVLCYFAITLFMFDCDYELNHKRYQLAYFEGDSVYRLPAYLLQFISPLCLGVIALLLLNKISFNAQLFIILFFLLILESISYLFYLRKCYR